jgi:hypothetical protein
VGRGSLAEAIARANEGKGVEGAAIAWNAEVRLRVFLAAAVVTLLVVAGGSAAAAPTPLPAHVYAPYFETWTTDSITTLAQQSGSLYFTLAFLETLSKSSCTLAWDRNPADPVSNGRYLADIGSLRALGGDVIPSFGGWSADQRGTEIADSCKDVRRIATAYESVITTYDVTRLDMDLEGRSLMRTAGIDRRNKAIKIVEAWAKVHRRPLQISYTLTATPSGLGSTRLAVLRNAKANRTRVDVVNLMTFDYYDGVTTDMGGAAISAAKGLFDQLRALYPKKTDAELWAMEGNTIQPGIDDYPKQTEVTYLSDAQTLLDFASSVGIGTLSMWAIQRDGGGCPGGKGPNCSGIVQDTWDFSHVLNSFTGP